MATQKEFEGALEKMKAYITNTKHDAQSSLRLQKYTFGDEEPVSANWLQRPAVAPGSPSFDEFRDAALLVLQSGKVGRRAPHIVVTADTVIIDALYVSQPDKLAATINFGGERQLG